MSAAHPQIPEKRRKGIDAWLDERLHTGKAIDFVLNHPVPLHIHPLDYLGEVTLFIFISQAVTGILLAMAYHPVAQTAYFYCDPITCPRTGKQSALIRALCRRRKPGRASALS